MLGFSALGEAALGEGGDLSSKFITSGFSQPLRRAGLTAAIVATTFVGFVPLPQAQAACVFTKFSEPLRKVIPQAGWSATVFVDRPPSAIFSSFAQPLPSRATLADEQPSALFEVRPASAVPFGGFSAFSQPQPSRTVLPDEQPSTLFESAPVVVPFVGFFQFGIPQFTRFSFVDQQTSTLFEAMFIPPVAQQGSGTSRKLDAPEPVVEAPRRKKKTGFEPAKKLPQQPAVETRQQLPLPPFKDIVRPELPETSPFDLVDRELIPDLAALQEQMRAAQAAYQDDQDARDIADIMAILDDEDER